MKTPKIIKNLMKKLMKNENLNEKIIFFCSKISLNLYSCFFMMLQTVA